MKTITVNLTEKEYEILVTGLMLLGEHAIRDVGQHSPEYKEIVDVQTKFVASFKE
jgi:hypothetical protein